MRPIIIVADFIRNLGSQAFCLAGLFRARQLLLMLNAAPAVVARQPFHQTEQGLSRWWHSSVTSLGSFPQKVRIRTFPKSHLMGEHMYSFGANTTWKTNEAMIMASKRWLAGWLGRCNTMTSFWPKLELRQRGRKKKTVFPLSHRCAL